MPKNERPIEDPMEPAGEIIEVTPELAGDWLEKNIENRPLSSAWVRTLADRIRRGDWVLNGETIKLNVRGELVDGQHRLSAVIEANTPIKTLVMFGAPENSYETIDVGKRRTIGDALALKGEKNHNVLGAALGWKWRYDNNLIAYAIPSAKRPSTHEILTVLDVHPGIRESVRHAEPVKGMITAALSAWLHYEFALRDEFKAADFFTAISTGANLPPESAVYRLRERIVKDRISKEHLDKETIAALAIKAWNAFRVDKPVFQLRISNDEAFPTIEPDLPPAETTDGS